MPNPLKPTSFLLETHESLSLNLEARQMQQMTSEELRIALIDTMTSLMVKDNLIRQALKGRF